MPRAKKPHLKRRPDGRFCCKYGGRSFYGDTEDEAFAARDAYKAAEKEGSLLRQSMTVSEYASAWLPVARPTVSESTYRGLATHLDHLCRHLGDTLLSDVRPLQIKQVYTLEYLNASQSYINGARQIFTDLFDSAVENGICKVNPVRSRDAAPHRGTSGGHRAITEQERWWIDHYCTDHRAHAAVMAMLYAGLRPQEMKALDIDRAVDFDLGTLAVTETAHRDGLHRYQITSEMKTASSRRVVPLFSPLRRALVHLHGPVVTNADGSPLTVQGWKCLWNSYVFHMETAINGCEKRWYGKTRQHKAILAAGGTLPPWQSFTVVPYDLRHSFCTMCRDHGVEMNTCIKWMGHADAKMILKIYDSVSDLRSRREAAKLEAAFSPPSASSPFSLAK